MIFPERLGSLLFMEYHSIYIRLGSATAQDALPYGHGVDSKLLTNRDPLVAKSTFPTATLRQGNTSINRDFLYK